MSSLVKVVPYQPCWPQLFESEAYLLTQALGKNCIDIYHIGSTAVPGLEAKPIIDIVPVVQDILEVQKSIPAMEELGYESKGEYGVLFRHYFQKGSSVRTHNVHVFEKGNPEIERHLKFCEWLRTHKQDKEAYAKLKTSLALQYLNDLQAYCLGKESFVRDIDAKTGGKRLRIVQALTEREWSTLKLFRQKYFFDRVLVSDPFTWTFQHKDHLHLVLYQGAHVVGYSHIQLWPHQRAALRIIVVMILFRNKGLAQLF